MKRNKWLIILAIIVILILGIVYYFLDYYNLIPKKYYSGEDFNIDYVYSDHDQDKDGVDDYIDLLNGARNFVEQNPKYKSEYYDGGYPPPGIGVCTDVVAAAFLEAGYDLRELVDQDIRNHREAYPEIKVIDKNIDYRRVRNLKIFFDRNAFSLTTDMKQIEKWQGGDIVIFPNHIAVVSDRRNKEGIPYIIHHGGQPVYEEDALKRYKGNILGHYRIDFSKLISRESIN